MKSRYDFETERQWLEYLRQHYAGQFMAAIISSEHMDPMGYMNGCAEQAVIAADALIAELDKTKL